MMKFLRKDEHHNILMTDIGSSMKKKFKNYASLLWIN